MRTQKPPRLWNEPEGRDFRGKPRLLRIMQKGKGRTGVIYCDIPFIALTDLLKENLDLKYSDLIDARVYAISPAGGNFSEKVYLEYDKFVSKLKGYQANFIENKTQKVEEKVEKKVETERDTSDSGLEQKIESSEKEERVKEENASEEIKFARIIGRNIIFGKKKERHDTSEYSFLGIVNPVSSWKDSKTPVYRTKEEIAKIAKERGANLIAERKNQLILVNYSGKVVTQKDYILK